MVIVLSHLITGWSKRQNALCVSPGDGHIGLQQSCDGDLARKNRIVSQASDCRTSQR